MIKHIVEHIDEEIQGKVCEKGCGVFHALLGYITLHGPFMYSPTLMFSKPGPLRIFIEV